MAITIEGDWEAFTESCMRSFWLKEKRTSIEREEEQEEGEKVRVLAKYKRAA